MISEVERMPQHAPWRAEGFIDFIGEQKDFSSMESLFNALDTVSLVEENVIFLKEDSRWESTSETREFARVKDLIEGNSAYYVQIIGTINARALEIQAACCPPGQSSMSLSSNGITDISLFKIGRGSSDLNSLEENHAHCEKCGSDLVNGVCGSCSKAA